MNAGQFPLTKNNFIFVDLFITYGEVDANPENDDVVRADGPFTVKFDEITLNFTSVPAE